MKNRLLGPCGHPMHGCHDQRFGARFYRCARSRAEYENERCDCRRISMRVIDDTVTSAIDTAFSNIDRLLALTSTRDSPQWWLALLERSIERQQARLAHQTVTLLTGCGTPSHDSCGSDVEFDIDTIIKSTRPANNRLRRTRARLAADGHDLTLLRHARDWYLRSSDTVPARFWLDTFDLRATITATTTCPRCNGSGAVRVGERSAGFSGAVCPDCDRYRIVPTLNITVAIPGLERFTI